MYTLGSRVLGLLGVAKQEVERDLIALGHLQEVLQQAARHLDHLHDAGGDLRDADARGSPPGRKIWMVLGVGTHGNRF